MKQTFTAILAVVFTFVTFVPLSASAQEVNYQLSSNPTAILSAIGAMNLPTMSDEDANEIRGEALPFLVVEALFYTAVALGIAYNKLYPYALWCTKNCNNVWDLYGSYWEALQIISGKLPTNSSMYYRGYYDLTVPGNIG